MFGLVIIVLAVALALTFTIRTQRRLMALRRRADEGDRGAAEEYDAALQAFPTRLIAPALGLHPRSDEP